MITELAPAKVNLALHIRRRRPDGYHDLETLFAFCSDGDRVMVEPAARGSFSVTGPFAASLLGEQDNLVTRARDAFRATFGATPVAITLDKHLPVASGIGGGSADAAATLRAMARLHGIGLDHPGLRAIAASLGADVPACLLGMSALGTGRGDDLQPLGPLGDIPALLVNPGVGVSTAAVFARWDGVDRGGVASAGSLFARARAGWNDLEPPARAIAPAIDDVLAMLTGARGASLTRMSGSGATCFALFDDAADRDLAARDAGARGWWTLATTLL